MASDSGVGFKYFIAKNSKAIIVIGILVLLAIPLFEMMYILGLKGLFGYFSTKIVNTTGTNPYLAKAVVLILLIPLMWSFKWTFSFRSQRRILGYSVVAAYILIFYVSMFLMTKEQKFDFSTGDAIKYYANTPEGLRYFDSPGFDPKYGIPLKPVDPKVARSEALSTRPPQSLEHPSRYFDFATQDPLVWYYENSDGTIEMFDQPGFHPKFAQELKPVTPEIVDKYEKHLQQKTKSPEIKSLAKIVDNPKQFFDSATNKPLVWFYEAQNGTIEFYDQPGFHPRYSEQLKPVTPEIVQKFEKRQQDQVAKSKNPPKRVDDPSSFLIQ